MTLKKCTCGKIVTTKTALRVIRFSDAWLSGLYFNCAHCSSTLILRSKTSRPAPNGKGVA